MSDNFYKFVESREWESPMAMALRIWREQEDQKEKDRE
jgi:hypothetical protein